jgi:hypothetical protein
MMSHLHREYLVVFKTFVSTIVALKVVSSIVEFNFALDWSPDCPDSTISSLVDAFPRLVGRPER